MKLVIALGGNALLQRTQAPSAAHLLANVQLAAAQVARIASAPETRSIVLTHGSGPQVGLLAWQSADHAAAHPDMDPGGYPLDMLDAEVSGLLAYLLEQEIANRLPSGPAVVSLLTRVEVDRADPAFNRPSKPIGPIFPRAQADRLASARRWAMVSEGGGLRRLVPSPAPRKVLAMPAVRSLLASGALVITAGGGGIPVVRRRDGASFEGCEAVIDKDLCSALIATELRADVLLIATDVPALCLDWGLPTQRAVGSTTPKALSGQVFAAGSMGPKVAAACAFVQATGGRAAIGALTDIEALLAGKAGTQIRSNER